MPRKNKIQKYVDSLGEPEPTRSPINGETEHQKKYRDLIFKYHLKITSDKFLGRTKNQFRQLLGKDPHLNNVPLREWDMTGVAFGVYNHHALSIAELCCMYKQLVIDWIREDN